MFRFRLTPKIAGLIAIVVQVFQERTILAAPRWKHMHMRDWPVAWR